MFNVRKGIKIRKIVSVLLALAMIFSVSSVAFAGTQIELKGEPLEITKLSDEMFIMTGDDGTAVMKIKENDSEMVVSVESVKGNVEEGFFLYNKDAETIYSSYTGKTFSVADIVSENEITPKAVGDVVSRKTHYISYAKLADAVTPTSSDISIASAIITIIAAAQGVTISTAAIIIVALLSTPAWDAVRAGIVDRSPNHGIKVVVATVEIQKHQGGRIVTGYKYEVESISTY